MQAFTFLLKKRTRSYYYVYAPERRLLNVI